MRKAEAMQRVARGFLTEPAMPRYGYQLRLDTGVRLGKLYRILDRMMADGWLVDGWEEDDAITGRPGRRFYRLTETGRRELEVIVGD